jgi:23S rRNA (pseudouridine1915-N3)-methyltransferase
MRLHVIAIGDRLVDWQLVACDDYARRFARPWSLQLAELRAEPRNEARPVERIAATEGERLLAAVPHGARRVVLDERGRTLSTRELADCLGEWQASGGDAAFLLGGPDGHVQALRESADLLLSLSPMTLPHGLARVVLLEQLYRVTTILAGHPYHRE